jgi:hypothetical protein
MCIGAALSAHTAQALSAACTEPADWPVYATIANANYPSLSFSASEEHAKRCTKQTDPSLLLQDDKFMEAEWQSRSHCITANALW